MTSSDPMGHAPDPETDLADDDLPEISIEGRALLSEAALVLRNDAERRWVEVAPRVLRTALRATRRSEPVRAHTSSASGGTVRVSEQVIVAYLREALDGHVPGTAVASIRIDITGRDTFAGLLIEIIVQYGTAILPAADLIRDRAADVILEILGSTSAAIDVRASHVHISDVTLGNPQIVAPPPAAGEI